jgi:type I restriction enzyme S subunit
MIYESIGNILDVSKGKKHNIAEIPSSDAKRVIGINDLRNDKNILLTNDEKGIFADEKDILIAWDGANAGTIGFGKQGFIGSTIARLRIKNPELFHTVYVGKLLQSKFDYLRASSTGATIPHINRAALDSIQVPVVKLSEQIHIANVLSKAEALIAKRKESLALLDAYLKSTFLEMFGDPVRNEKGWDKKRIDEIAEVRIGPFGSLLHAEDYIENGIPLVNPSHIIKGEIEPDYSLTITEEKYKELDSYKLQLNDVIVARRGEIGRCALVKKTTPLICGTGSMFIRIITDYFPVLLQYQIYNTSLRDFLESKAKGVTMKNLNSTTLGDLQILFPPLELQNQFAAVVEKVEALKETHQESLRELEALYGSLSQRAFRGELGG